MPTNPNHTSRFPLAAIREIALLHPGAIKIGPFGSQLKKEDLSRVGYKVYGQENIIAGDFSIGTRRIDSTKFSVLSSCRLFPGDLVLTMMGTIGKCAIFPKDAEVGIMDSHLLRIQVNPEIANSRFIAMMIAAEEVVGRQIERLSHGSIMSGLSSTIVQRLQIPLPPLTEQYRIVDILDTVDTQIQRTEQLIAKLKLQKTGLLQSLLTCGLDELGQLRDSIAHPEQFKDSMLLGRIPKAWEIRNLASISLKVTDGCHQSVTTSNNGIPFLFVSCIRDGQILWERSAKISEEVYKAISKGREPKSGVVLYTIVGSYGHAALTQNDHPFSFQRHIAYILPDTTIIIPLFLTYWLNSIWSRSHADKIALGNAQKTIILSELNSFPVILPSLEEQSRIIAIVEKQDRLIRVEETYLNKLKLYKKGLMQDLLMRCISVNTEEKMFLGEGLLCKDTKA